MFKKFSFFKHLKGEYGSEIFARPLVKLPATSLAMAPNSYAYIRIKAEFMFQQLMLRKLKNHVKIDIEIFILSECFHIQ